MTPAGRGSDPRFLTGKRTSGRAARRQLSWRPRCLHTGSPNYGYHTVRRRLGPRRCLPPPIPHAIIFVPTIQYEGNTSYRRTRPQPVSRLREGRAASFREPSRMQNGPRGPTRNLDNYLPPALTPALRPRPPRRSLIPITTANIHGTGSPHLPSAPSKADGARSPIRSLGGPPRPRRLPERRSCHPRCLRRSSRRRWRWSVRPSRGPSASCPRSYRRRRRRCPARHRRDHRAVLLARRVVVYAILEMASGLLHPRPAVASSGRPRRGRPPALLSAPRLPRRRRRRLGTHEAAAVDVMGQRRSCGGPHAGHMLDHGRRRLRNGHRRGE